mgnify:CR=1 FL=1
MDFANIKLPIGIIALVIAQGFGVIWYMSGQDSAVAGLEGTVSVLEERIEEMSDNLEETVKTQAVITNEMRSIMADHMGFADTLKDMGQSGALPSGERRTYGGY